LNVNKAKRDAAISSADTLKVYFSDWHALPDVEGTGAGGGGNCKPVKPVYGGAETKPGEESLPDTEEEWVNGVDAIIGSDIVYQEPDAQGTGATKPPNKY